MTPKFKSWLAGTGTVAGYGVIAAFPTYAAQINSLTTGLNWISTTLTGVAVVTVTIAVIWVGFKMIFQHSRLQDVMNIIIGAVVIGGGSAIASALVNGNGG